MNDIQTWKVEDLKNFYKTYYQPRNAVLVVSGDIGEETVFELAEKRFGDLKNSRPVPETAMPEPEQTGARRTLVHKESEVEMVAIAWHIPPYDHEEITALSMLSELLGSGQSSRLHKSLVDEKRLANQKQQNFVVTYHDWWMAKAWPTRSTPTRWISKTRGFLSSWPSATPASRRKKRRRRSSKRWRRSGTAM